MLICQINSVVCFDSETPKSLSFSVNVKKLWDKNKYWLDINYKINKTWCMFLHSKKKKKKGAQWRNNKTRMKWGWKTFFTLADVNMTRMLNTEAPNIKHQGGILVQVCKILIMPLLCMHACTVYCMFVLTLWSLFNVFYHILHIINYNITKASTEKTLFQRGKKKTFSVAWKEAKQRYLHYCIFLRFNTIQKLTHSR